MLLSDAALTLPSSYVSADFLYAVCRRDPPAIKAASHQPTGNAAIVAHLSSLPSSSSRLLPPHFLDPAADLATMASCLSKAVDQMVSSGALPSNFEAGPGIERQYPVLGIVGRMVDDEGEVRRLRFQRDSFQLLRATAMSPTPTGETVATGTQYALSPPPTPSFTSTSVASSSSTSPPTKRPNRSQTVSSATSLFLSPSTSSSSSSSTLSSAADPISTSGGPFSPTYSLSKTNSNTNSPRSRSSHPPSPSPPLALAPARSIGRNGGAGGRPAALSFSSSAGGARRPSLPVSMQQMKSYPSGVAGVGVGVGVGVGRGMGAMGGGRGGGGSGDDSEDERDEREERLARLGRFAGQRAEMPVGMPSAPPPRMQLGAGVAEDGVGEKKKEKEKGKGYGWSVGWGVGAGKV